MKKLVLTAVVVGFAAVAAQAQSIEAKMASGIWGKSMTAQVDKKAMAQADSLNAALAKKIEQEQLRQAKEAAQKAEENKKAKENKQAKENKGRPQHFTHLPATGVMRDYAVEGRLQQSTAQPAIDKSVTKPVVEKQKTKKEGASWLARVMGFEKFQNETNEEHYARLIAMAMK